MAHDEQAHSRREPHPPQNLAESAHSWSHCRHFIAPAYGAYRTLSVGTPTLPADRTTLTRPWGTSTVSSTSSASTGSSAPTSSRYIQGDRRRDVGASLRAGVPDGQPARARTASGPRTASRSSRRTASSTSRCSSAPRCSTPSCVDVNWRLAAPEVEYIVNDAAREGARRRRGLRAGARRHRRQPHHRHQDPRHRRQRRVRRLRRPRSPRSRPPTPASQQAADDVAFQLYSSGTTGRPKGVMLTNTNFFGLLPMAKEMWELDDRQREPRRDAAVPHRRRRLGRSAGHVRRARRA